MSDPVFKLLWALPLVLLIGLAAIALLKRLGVGTGRPDPRASGPALVSTTPISEETKVLVVRHGGQEWLVFESRASVQVFHGDPPPSSRQPHRYAHPWFNGHRT